MSEIKEIVHRGLPETGNVPLDFGVALEALRNGKKIWRTGWNKNTIRIAMIGVPVGSDESASGQHTLGIPASFDEEGKLMDYWHPSPTDLFSEDWRFE